MHAKPLILIALFLSGAARAADPATVNPYTGTEATVADLKRTLDIERLRSEIVEEKRRQKKVEDEMKAPPKPETRPGQFGTLKFPTDKLPIPDLTGLSPSGKPRKGGQAAPAPVTSVVVAPLVPAGPRLVGVMSDEAGRVAIIELGGKLMQASAGQSAHGLKVSRIGEGWAEVGGKRLAQDNSALALVTNVDKQPVAPRVGSPTGMVPSGSPAPTTMPAGQPMSFMPPGFGGQ